VQEREVDGTEREVGLGLERKALDRDYWPSEEFLGNPLGLLRVATIHVDLHARLYHDGRSAGIG